MASDVDICNLALGYLGDRATVSSINPPEGSAQAGHCASFYPIARDSLIERRNWSFATKRATPAGVEVSIAQWQYAYSLPINTLDVIAVLSPGGAENYSDLLYEGAEFSNIFVNPDYLPQPYSLETQDDGTVVVYTNQADATIMYVVRVTDTNKFTPLFIRALARLLASDLAGPVIKGREGTNESVNQLRIFESIFAQADVKDANRSSDNASHNYVPQSIRSRR